ncbi:MAG: type VI secretion system accessory protein TagJ [Longimicrobiales bacterium]
MDAVTLYRAGKLEEAIQAVGTKLRAEPGDLSSRTFLFELLLFAGELGRAEKQLDVVARANSQAEMGAWVYRSALHAEKLRQEMFETDTLPAGGIEPSAPSGTLNGQPFDTVTDADPRIGARLEVFAAGQYTWIPFEQLETVTAEQPQRLRDLLWIPAQVKAGEKFTGAELGEVIIPALSPGSDRHTDDMVRLGRATDWVEVESGIEAPVGQKLLLVDGEAFPLLELRELRIGPQAAIES